MPYERLLLARPHSAAVHRLPPWKAHRASLQVTKRKDMAGYASPHRVAASLSNAVDSSGGATTGGGDGPTRSMASDDPMASSSLSELDALCRRVAKGNRALEEALRREWTRCFDTQ